jgi:hypothetical protein
MDNFQLSASNLRAVGYGKARLKNKAAPPASENRRVEVVVPEWWLAIGDSRSSRVQCRIRSRVSAASGASVLSCFAIWPTVNGIPAVNVGVVNIGRGFVSDSAANTLRPFWCIVAF